MTIVGGDVYPDPPEVTVIIPIVFESFKTIFGDIKAFGFKVLSEEYSWRCLFHSGQAGRAATQQSEVVLAFCCWEAPVEPARTCCAACRATSLPRALH